METQPTAHIAAFYAHRIHRAKVAIRIATQIESRAAFIGHLKSRLEQFETAKLYAELMAVEF